MNAQAPASYGLSSEARNLQWLLAGLVDEVPGIRSVAVVSSDGLLLLTSDQERRAGRRRESPAQATEPEAAASSGAPSASPPGALSAAPSADASATPRGPRGAGADLATIVSGLGSLTCGAARLMDGGAVKQTMVAMDEGSLFVMSISDGSLLGVHATPDCDMSVVAYHMALFVGRAGHVLTPELRSELRKSMESAQ